MYKMPTLFLGIFLGERNCRFLKEFHFSSVHLLSHVGMFVTPRTAACQASLSITNSWSLLRLMVMQSVSHGVSDAIQLSHSLLSPSLPAFNFSQHQGLSQ